MSLIFRVGRNDDVPAAAELARHSFPGVPRNLEEWQHELADSPRGGLDALWVASRGGTMAGFCQLYPLTQWVAGQRLPVMGLGTVAISPTERRRGLAGQMIEAAFHHAIERGDVASALFPFRTSFYRRLGYGFAGEVHQYTFPPAALAVTEERAGVTLASTANDRAAISRVYDRWVVGQSGQIAREGRLWDAVWRPDVHGVLFRGAGGEPGGYALFRYETGGSRAVEVQEIVWTEPLARAALHAWVATLGDQWERIVYPAHPEEGFGERLGELRNGSIEAPRWHFWFPAAVVLRGPMFRLLHLERAWSARAVNVGDPLTVALEVQDPQVPANQGSWRLVLADQRVQVRRGDGGSGADLRLTTTVETLSRIFIGDLAPSAAVMAGLATADRHEPVALLDGLLRVPRPWMFDRF